MFEGQAIIFEAYATHRITNIEGGETVLHPGGVALDSEHPAPVIYLYRLSFGRFKRQLSADGLSVQWDHTGMS